MTRSRRYRGLFRASILIAAGLAVLISRGYDGGSFDLGRVWESIVGKFSTGSVERLFAEERSNVFVELEGKNVGCWLSTYTLEPDAVGALQSAIDARIEAALGDELGA